MDTKTLLAESKARFNHNSAKSYLNEKYSSKLLVAEQGGLWRADVQTISFLNSMNDDNFIVLMDTFNNPVQVNREELLTVLKKIYSTVMLDWHKEWKELESKR
jgi:hypothetical protein